MDLLVGINYFAGSPDLIRRQHEAIEVLKGLRNVQAIDLQFRGATGGAGPIETVATLELDARKVSGLQGRPKPVLSEIFDTLAFQAQLRGCRTFCFINSDILLTQAAVDLILTGERESWLFSRMEYEPPGRSNPVLQLMGIDMFALDVEWWWENRSRFRPYILGDYLWDNIYTAIILSHSNGLLLDDQAWIWHERHENVSSSSSPYAPFLQMLAGCDSLYFSKWAVYHHHRLALRAAGKPRAEEIALQQSVFGRTPGKWEKRVQRLRAWRARRRFHSFLKHHPEAKLAA